MKSHKNTQVKYKNLTIVLKYTTWVNVLCYSPPHSHTDPFTPEHSRVSVLILPAVVHPAEQHPGLLQLGGVHRRAKRQLCGLTGTQKRPRWSHVGICHRHRALLLLRRTQVVKVKPSDRCDTEKRVSRRILSYICVRHCVHKRGELLLCVVRCHWEAVGCSVAGSWMAGVVTECRLWCWGPLLVAHCHVWVAVCCA